MYAFCPVPDLKDDVCGFGHSVYDFNFYASNTTQYVKTDKIRFIDRAGLDQTQRKHHVCHYIIHPEKDQIYGDDAYMMLKFDNITNLFVRIYEGTTRETAYKPIVEFNAQASNEFEYRVKWNSGLLVIVFADNKDVETNFEFSYWIN